MARASRRIELKVRDIYSQGDDVPSRPGNIMAVNSYEGDNQLAKVAKASLIAIRRII